MGIMDIMGNVETKLVNDVDILNIRDGKYNLWMRNRKSKEGGGVMPLVGKDLMVESTTCGEGEPEIMKVSLKRNLGRCQNIVVTSVPPYSNSWGEEEYKRMLEDKRTCTSDGRL